jgi:molybdenum cofactor cytidylyltransferase
VRFKLSLNIKTAEIKAGLIILAAGESVRMGRPKQLLEFKGETLLRRTAKTAIDSACHSIVAVLGAKAEILEKELRGLNLEIVHNKDWKTGMSSSIKAGLEKLLEKNRELQAVVITVCDQPFVSAEIIDNLIEKHRQTNALIVASHYAETLGVPALFDRRLFFELENLTEKSGAKSLIKKFQDQAVALDFPAGVFDIDTPEDYADLTGAGFLG